LRYAIPVAGGSMNGYKIAWVSQTLLAKIATIRSARLTGSFARGCPHNDSDLDFRMKGEDVTSFARWLKETGREFGSELPGHVTVDGIEIYSEFHRTNRADRLDAVMINGIVFKTW